MIIKDALENVKCDTLCLECSCVGLKAINHQKSLNNSQTVYCCEEQQSSSQGCLLSIVLNCIQSRSLWEISSYPLLHQLKLFSPLSICSPFSGVGSVWEMCQAGYHCLCLGVCGTCTTGIHFSSFHQQFLQPLQREVQGKCMWFWSPCFQDWLSSCLVLLSFPGQSSCTCPLLFAACSFPSSVVLHQIGFPVGVPFFGFTHRY